MGGWGGWGAGTVSVTQGVGIGGAKRIEDAGRVRMFRKLQVDPLEPLMGPGIPV